MMDEDVPIKKFHWMDVCIKCDRRSSGKLLTCHDNGCPVVVHQDCLGCEAEFDEMGNFCCPYCVYKRAFQGFTLAERKAVLAEKTLSKFLNGEGIGVGVVETVNVDGNSDVRSQCVEIGPECIMRDGGADVFLVNNEGVVLLNRVGDKGGLVDDIDRVEVVEKQNDECCSGQGKVDQNKDVDMNRRSHSGDKIQIDATGTESFLKYHHNAGHFEAHDFVKENATAVEGNEGRMDQVHNQEQAHKTTEKSVLKESVPQVHMEANRKVDDTTASTCMDTHTISEEVAGSQPPYVDIPKRLSRKQKSVHIEESSTPRKSSKVAKPPTTFTKLPTLIKKRKRAAWKVEEEEMLKKGVQKYSKSVNKNVPWQKILEDGRGVFDETRTPADLKDKWRNLLSKEPLFEFS